MHSCGHTFSERQVGAIMKMALHGLAALHRVGVIHRDIKGNTTLHQINREQLCCHFHQEQPCITLCSADVRH